MNKKSLQLHFYQEYCNRKKVDPSIVLIESFHGQNISDSGLEIAKEILSTYKDQYTVYFASENIKAHEKYIKDIGLNVKLVDVDSLTYVKILATAGQIYTNAGLPMYFIKREGQFYLQTWHGTPLKKLGKRMRKGLDSMCVAQRAFLQADYLLQPNDFTKNAMMNDYNIEEIYTGKVMLAGYPRNKIFMQPEKGIAYKKELGYEGKEVIIYMPTWRGTSPKDTNIDEYAQGVKEIFDQLDQYLRDDQIFFVKFHPILRDAIKLNDYQHIEKFPDGVEAYEFINMADLLVTDYSSIFFDFSLTKKPVILFTYDYDQYMSDRGFYMDIRELPFRLIEETSELGTCLRDGSYKDDRYDDTPYYQEFLKYDHVDVTKEIVKLAITGDDSWFTIEDYSENRGKEVHVVKPRALGESDLKVLSQRRKEDDKMIAWMYRPLFKEGVSELLHDKYNDDFTYIITNQSVPSSFFEKVMAKLKNKKVLERLKARDYARSLPNLKVTSDERI